MKRKLLMLLFAGAIMTGVGGCEPGEGKEFDPLMDCWVFVKTSPGEEVILLAKSGLTVDEAFAIEDEFESEYGKENVWAGFSKPIEESFYGIYNTGKDYTILNPGAVPYCYEITMTIDFSGTSMPSIKDLYESGFQGVRIINHTAICKIYNWAFTEEGADEFIQKEENRYNVYYNKYPGGGTIIGTTTIKYIGSEVHNEPIIF